MSHQVDSGNKPLGFLSSGIEEITKTRNPLMQTGAIRLAAEDGYNDIGIVYGAPFYSSGKIQSDHLPILDADGKLGDFYCLTEGFDKEFNARNSKGHVLSLAAALAFMEHSYPILRAAENPREMMNTLARKTVEGLYSKVLRNTLNGNLDMSLVGVLPGTTAGTARVVALNLGSTNVMKYESQTGNYSFLFNGRSNGESVLSLEDRGIELKEVKGYLGSSESARSFIPASLSYWKIEETVIKEGDEIYLLSFIADAWMNPNSASKPYVGEALMKGAKRINLVSSASNEGKSRQPIGKIVENLAKKVNDLDKEWYQGSKMWWDCGIIGLKYIGEDNTSDSKALYCNELIKLAGETINIMKQLGIGNVEQNDIKGLLPAPLQSLVKTDK